MRLDSLVSPPFSPNPRQSTVLELGLRQLDPRQWMRVDADYPQFQQHKLDLGERCRDKVYFANKDSEPAQQEFHQLLLQHLLQDHNGVFTTRDQELFFDASYQGSSDFLSLWHTTLWVQEDIAILEQEKGEYCLSAASVCSPSNWKLEEKRGRTLDMIHSPVPDYDKILAARVNRFFDKLKVSAPIYRYNWSIQGGNELCWREDQDVAVESSHQAWYWRVERQTLRRLARTKAVVFGIRIYLHPLSSMTQDPVFMPQLCAILARLPQNEQRYKGLHRFLRELVDGAT